MHLQNTNTLTHAHTHHRVHARRHHEHIYRWIPIQASDMWSDARLVCRYRDINMDMDVSHGMYEIIHLSIYWEMLFIMCRFVLQCVAVCCCVLLCVAVCCCVLLCVAVSANMDVGMDERILRINISHWCRYKPAILEAVKRVNLCPKLIENAFSETLLMSSFQKIAADPAFKNRASRGLFCVTLLKNANWLPDPWQKAWWIVVQKCTRSLEELKHWIAYPFRENMDGEKSIG